jgi:hypothetical protein
VVFLVDWNGTSITPRAKPQRELWWIRRLVERSSGCSSSLCVEDDQAIETVPIEKASVCIIQSLLQLAVVIAHQTRRNCIQPILVAPPPLHRRFSVSPLSTLSGRVLVHQRRRRRRQQQQRRCNDKVLSLLRYSMEAEITAQLIGDGCSANLVWQSTVSYPGLSKFLERGSFICFSKSN